MDHGITLAPHEHRFAVRRPTLDRVKYVEYELHPTIPKPVRRSTNRSTNFRLATAGWGGFTIYRTNR